MQKFGLCCSNTQVEINCAWTKVWVHCTGEVFRRNWRNPSPVAFLCVQIILSLVGCQTQWWKCDSSVSVVEVSIFCQGPNSFFKSCTIPGRKWILVYTEENLWRPVPDVRPDAVCRCDEGVLCCGHLQGVSCDFSSSSWWVHYWFAQQAGDFLSETPQGSSLRNVLLHDIQCSGPRRWKKVACQRVAVPVSCTVNVHDTFCDWIQHGSYVQPTLGCSTSNYVRLGYLAGSVCFLLKKVMCSSW